MTETQSDRQGGDGLPLEVRIQTARYAMFRLLRSRASHETLCEQWSKLETLLDTPTRDAAEGWDDLNPVRSTLRKLEKDLRACAISLGEGDDLGAVLQGYAEHAAFALSRRDSATPMPAPDAMRSPRDVLRSICPAGGDLGCSCADQNYQWFGEGCKRDIVAAYKKLLAAPVPSPGGAFLPRVDRDELYSQATQFINQWHGPHDLAMMLERFAEAAILNRVPSATGAAEPGADRTMWDWDKIAEAAFQRACLSDHYAADQLRPAFRAIIEAGLAATPPVRGDREIAHQAIYKHLYQALEKTGLSEIFLTRDLWQATKLAADDLSLPVQPGAGEREKALRDEIFCLREVVRGVRILDHAGRFKEYDGEPWLRRVRNIGLDHDPVEFNRQAPQSSREG